ncbi:uncharacterized protein LOC125041904 [Penaeus chinensis]|uniref:uncharacterized protein LOC125041904 n=1 Tax=Penaeus chinensis TaxID=139456 RepID=UPI001FB6892A|nr:uncharacterized protein LOC125041904 [Penaeus chinensis]
MEAASKAWPEVGLSTTSGEQLPLVQSAGEVKPLLHAGFCSAHGGFRFFWCATCRTWLCRECTVVDHPNDLCEVLSLKEAVSTFQREEEDAVVQLKLRRLHTFSLIRKGDELKAAVQRILKVHGDLMEDLQKEQETLEAFLERKEEKTPDLESVLLGLAEESEEREDSEESEESEDSEDSAAENRKDRAARSRQTLEVWYQNHKERMIRLTKCLEAKHTRKMEKIHFSISALQRLNIMAASKPEKNSLNWKRLTQRNLTLKSLREVLAEDPDMFERGLILQLSSGTFFLRDVCRAFGEDNIKCIEQTYNNIFIMTVKNTTVRDHIATTFKSIEFSGRSNAKTLIPTNSAIYNLHNVAPTSACVKGILTGIPTFLSSRNLDGLHRALSDAFPLLEKVELLPLAWEKADIQSGKLALTSETEDLEALDSFFQSCDREVDFSNFTGKLTNIKAESQIKEVLLPEKPFEQGFSFKSWCW